MRADKVITLFKKCRDQGDVIYISDIVLCETAWVLRSRYRFKQDEILNRFEDILCSYQIRLASASRLRRAIYRAKSGKGDFADYLINEDSLEHGAEVLLTFDKELLKESGFSEP